MSDFNPEPNQQISIEGESYKVAPHPSAPRYAFGQTGRKGTVYKLLCKRGQKAFALKVFLEPFRNPALVELTSLLEPCAKMPGLEACQRQILTSSDFGQVLVRKYPDLEFAVLMPWSNGRTWHDVILNSAKILPEVGIEIARRVAEVLSNLEAHQLAHCDISSGNVMINVDSLEISLIDVEDMYGPHFPTPQGIPLGTEGYNHLQVRSEGQWKLTGDRFAGAIIIVEMLCWHSDTLREAVFEAEDNSCFPENELQDVNSPRFKLALEILSNLPNVRPSYVQQLLSLFERAWISSGLEDCPSLAEWATLLAKISLVRVPMGTKLTSSEIDWPVRVWRPLPEIIPSQSPVKGFSQPNHVIGNTVVKLKAPRFTSDGNPFGQTSFMLSWMGVAGASTYEVQESLSSDFNDINQIYSGPALSIAISNRQPGIYYYRVRAVHLDQIGSWSTPLDIKFRHG